MLFQTTESHEALRAKIRAFAETEVKAELVFGNTVLYTKLCDSFRDKSGIGVIFTHGSISL